MTTNNDQNQTSQESQAFKSAVRKLMQVPQQELKEKLAEAEAEKSDRASESNPDESDRSVDQA